MGVGRVGGGVDWRFPVGGVKWWDGGSGWLVGGGGGEGWCGLGGWYVGKWASMLVVAEMAAGPAGAWTGAVEGVVVEGATCPTTGAVWLVVGGAVGGVVVGGAA